MSVNRKEALYQSYVTVRFNDIYGFLCQYRRVNRMVDISVNNVLQLTLAIKPL